MNPPLFRCSDQPVSLRNLYTGLGGIFFDRDGTIIEEKNYLSNISDLKLLKGAFFGLKKLQKLGLPMYFVTNQAGVAHGFFDEEQLRLVHNYLIEQLQKLKINFRGTFYCPHHPQAEIPEYRCDCFYRKPNPGLLFQAARFDNLNLMHSYIIGDKLTDLEAGKRVGAKAVLVLTGYGNQESAIIQTAQKPDFIAPDISAAADWIIYHHYQNQAEKA